jgi:hypothetical protein
MPVLDRWVGSHANRKPPGVTMLLIQHQLGNHVPQAGLARLVSTRAALLA